MSQLMMEYTPIARGDDPASSHLAAEQVTKSGIRRAQKIEILRAVAEHPERTSKELTGYLPVGFDRYVTARRLPELERDGLVYREGRKLELGAELRWHATQAGRAFLAAL